MGLVWHRAEKGNFYSSPLVDDWVGVRRLPVIRSSAAKLLLIARTFPAWRTQQVTGNKLNSSDWCSAHLCFPCCPSQQTRQSKFSGLSAQVQHPSFQKTPDLAWFSSFVVRLRGLRFRPVLRCPFASFLPPPVYATTPGTLVQQLIPNVPPRSKSLLA